MNRWNRYFYGPVAAVRPYLFQKCFLLVVGTDALVLMAERGCRYGIDGFNVAHFEWLDGIQPLPSATWYVGTLMLVCVLAYTACFLGTSRTLLAALALLYTYSWAMSRHDSYLHHYMISLILACMVFFPRIAYKDLLPVYAGAKSAGGALPEREPTKTVRGAWFVPVVLGLAIVYRTVDVLAASWLAFFAFFALLAGLIVVFVRRSGIAGGPLTSAWAYRLLGATVGVIYIYTSAAKADAEWCGGYTLRRVGSTTEVLTPFVRLAEAVGLPSEWFWSVVATMVIPLELTIAASYFLATRQDEPERRWLPRWCGLAWVLAVGLHLNNEMMNLTIQWFGYYMMFLATFFLMPQRVLWAVGACVVLPAHWWHSHVMQPLFAAPRVATAAAVTALAAAVLYAAGRFIALPGALWALPVAAGVVVLYAAFKELEILPRLSRETSAVAAAAGLAGLGMIGVTSQSSLRHDYYWGLGTELQHLTALPGDYQGPALAAYEIAESYGAPNRLRETELMINMGLAHRRLGNIEKALAYYARALAVDPTSGHAHYNAGVAHQTAGDYSQAAESFRAATTLQPDYLIAHLQLARTQELLGEFEGALASLRSAQRLRPNDLAIQEDVARLIRQTRSSPQSSQPHATTHAGP